MFDLDVYLLAWEFYAIEAISVMLGRSEYGDFQPMHHSHSRWYQDFQEFRNRYVSQFALAIYDYTVLAVAAEMRHAKTQASHSMRDYFRGVYERDAIYRDCTIYNPTGLLTAGLQLFDPKRIEWKRSYGGECWWHIAKAGLLKGKVKDHVFIDHCLDLSHNNNVYFDKGAGIFHLQDARDYKRFLDYKRVCAPQDLLRDAPGYYLNQLLLRADTLGILRNCKVGSVLSADIEDMEQQLLRYFPIRWGGKSLNFAIQKNKRLSYGEQREDDRNDEDETCYPLPKAA